ncbi:MAG: glutathione S-transferase family protein [Myxococcota bacterium]
MDQLVLCEVEDAAPLGVPSMSPFCVKVHLALALAGLPYERRHGAHPGVFASLNPARQVPILLEGGRPIPDSTAILQRILALAPGRIAVSPEAWLWEELADTAVNGFLVASRWADDDNWPRLSALFFGKMPIPVRWVLPRVLRRRVVGALVARDVWRSGGAACWDRFDRLLDQLEGRAPATGFWCGDAPSVADIGLYGQLRSFGTAVTPRQAAMVAARPALTAWIGRVGAAAGGLALAA